MIPDAELEAKRIKNFELYALMKQTKYKSNIPLLKKNCNDLMTMACQMTGGQRERDKTNGSIPFENLDMLLLHIAIEACCLCLSGDIDKIPIEGE
jgi:hypothetical protein